MIKKDTQTTCQIVRGCERFVNTVHDHNECKRLESMEEMLRRVPAVVPEPEPQPQPQSEPKPESESQKPLEAAPVPTCDVRGLFAFLAAAAIVMCMVVILSFIYLFIQGSVDHADLVNLKYQVGQYTKQQAMVARSNDLLSDDPEFNEWFCTQFDGIVFNTRDYNELQKAMRLRESNDGDGWRYTGGLLVFGNQHREKACANYRRDNKGPFKAPLQVPIHQSEEHRAPEKLYYLYCMQQLVLDMTPRFKSSLNVHETVEVPQSPYNGSEMRSIMMKHFSDPWMFSQTVMTKLVYDLRSDYCNALTGAFTE